MEAAPIVARAVYDNRAATSSPVARAPSLRHEIRSTAEAIQAQSVPTGA